MLAVLSYIHDEKRTTKTNDNLQLIFQVSFHEIILAVTIDFFVLSTKTVSTACYLDHNK